MRGTDWWRFGRALAPIGIGKGDIVQNCFSYHFTPAGMMFESAAASVGATVVPAGTGQTELQAQAVAALGVTAYAGTPDYLKAILEKGEELGLDMSSVTKACVSGGPLFPALREEYDRRGILCRQCYGTADVGHVAYESVETDGLILDEGVVVEIVRPGTGDPVRDGEIGEVVVTTLNPDFPMIRFATGDLSAILPGLSLAGGPTGGLLAGAAGQIRRPRLRVCLFALNRSPSWRPVLMRLPACASPSPMMDHKTRWRCNRGHSRSRTSLCRGGA